MSVWLILIPAFLFVGIWLIVYNNKRGALMRKFAQSNSYEIDRRGDSDFENELDKRFALPAPYTRAFSMIRDLIDLPEGKLFRVTELMDLSRYGISQNTHSGRIALYIPYKSEIDLFFLVKREGSLQQIIPEYPLPNNQIADVDAVRKFIQEHPPAHDLILTCQDDFLLVYHAPFRTGSESLSELAYLVLMAKELAQ